MMIKNILLPVFMFITWAALAQPSSFANGDSLLICGHRGGFYPLLPENSMAAFEFTANRYNPSRVVVEFDIRKSKDGTLFIMHDETVDRTTNGTGKTSELSDAYLETL